MLYNTDHLFGSIILRKRLQYVLSVYCYEGQYYCCPLNELSVLAFKEIESCSVRGQKHGQYLEIVPRFNVTDFFQKFLV